MKTKSNRKKGLLMIFTGNGKGKTTSALGLAFRAMGHGLRICMIQFIKGQGKYGELESAEHFPELMEVHVMGRGFTWASEDLEKDIAAARKAWDFAGKIIRAGKHDIIILDELTYLVTYGMIDEQVIIDILKSRPPWMHIVVTGRGATEQMIDAADLVTEMVAVKHPYENGIIARKGIEY